MLTRWYRKATSLYEKELLLKLIRFYQSNWQRRLKRNEKEKIFTEQQIEVIKEIVRDEIKKADKQRLSALGQELNFNPDDY